MVDYDPREAADALLDAYRSRVPIAPLTETTPGLSIEQAYAIQLAQVEHWKSAGHTIKGHKVGLTSRAMQLQLGVDQPDYGHLREDMFHLDSAPVDLDRFISPKVEPEISFVLKRPLAGPGVTVAEAISAVDFAIASLEIIDSRIADWRITLADTIADNASSGGVVLGSRCGTSTWPEPGATSTRTGTSWAPAPAGMSSDPRSTRWSGSPTRSDSSA